MTTTWIFGAVVGLALGIGAGARANNRVVGGDDVVAMCKSSSDCGDRASCESGKCKNKDSHKLVDGESCSSSFDCDSADCRDGKCKAKNGKGADAGMSCDRASDCKSNKCYDHKCK